MVRPGQKFDKYTVLRQLGEGGMSFVYEAVSPFGVNVVLKVLHPDFQGHADVGVRFKREGRIQFTLRHPNIVRVTDMVEQDGLPALVMDFLAGVDLDAAMSSGHRFDLPDTLKVATGILDALQCAHDSGFVHRDIKPSNIFLERMDGGFEPRLMDFGIAKIDAAAGLTRAREFYGTPAYTSPEQIHSTRDVDGRTDVYSMGVVLWQLVCGNEPYEDLKSDPYAVLSAVVKEPLPRLPEKYPRWLCDIVTRATQKDPDDRFASPKDFRNALLEGAGSSDDLAKTMLIPAPDGGYLDTTNPLPADSGLEAIVTEVRNRQKSQSNVDFDSMAEFNVIDPSSSSIVSGLQVSGTDVTEPAVDRVRVPNTSNTPPKPLDFDIHELARELEEETPSPREPQRPKARTSVSVAPVRKDGGGFEPDSSMARPVKPMPVRRHRPRPQLPAPPPAPKWTAKLGGVGAVLAILVALGVAAFAGYTVLNKSESAPSGFTRIEPGTYTIGSPDDEAGRDRDEVAHAVTLTRAFAISHTEVTRGEWTLLMFSEPDAFADCGPSCPVAQVSWVDAARYANRLSTESGLDKCYEITELGQGAGVAWPLGLDCLGYRLPTEAEWEIAARAGTDTALPNGNIRHLERSLIDPALQEIAWYGANSHAAYGDASDCSSWSSDHLHCGLQPIRQKQVNGYNLYDVFGNAAEWVWDIYGPYDIDVATNIATDPIGAPEGTRRVVRGCSWSSTASDCRAGARESVAPIGRPTTGFRLARTLY
jgi:serine/threonine protein kinase/formylglycine-generating enzyme required for sulfatase activity